MANKGFITDWQGNKMLPITRGELVLDQYGIIALNSNEFLAGGKDGKNGLPGLITAAERAMLSGSSTGGGIADIYTKLDYINTGLKFKNTLLNFYSQVDNVVTATPINITSSRGIDIKVTGQNVDFGLEELKTTETTASQILKSITVDKYGRVTAVSGAPLLNSEIPNLDGKTISNSTLTGCVTDSVGSSANSIVNKDYVDKAITNVTGIATGALKFDGSLSSSEQAIAALSNIDHQNCYYKVTSEFTIEAQYLYSETESSQNQLVNPGDTLIIYPISLPPNTYEAKFVYVPSGDDITTITVKKSGDTNYVLKDVLGNVAFQFSDIFNVDKIGDNTASISIPEADANTDGFLSSEKFKLFNSYADSLKVQYQQTAPTTGAGIYEIGILTVGSTPTTLYGKNDTYSLSIINNTVNQVSTEYNPILRFTNTGVGNTDIVYKGIGGIKVRKSSNDIEIYSANEAITQEVPNTSNSIKYITIEDGYKFGIQLGGIEEQTDGSVKVVDGLTDYSEFAALRNAVWSKSTIFESIDYSLKGEASTTQYRYGNDLLIQAIGGTRTDGTSSWDILLI